MECPLVAIVIMLVLRLAFWGRADARRREAAQAHTDRRQHTAEKEHATSNPTNGSPFDARVMIEIMRDGVPRRVNVWASEGETFISFAPDTSEAEATEIVARGLGLIRPLDVSVLFREGGKRRRFIDPD